MENFERRLEDLRQAVLQEQLEGPVIFWPERIKKEAVELAIFLGEDKVSKNTNLHKSTIVGWMQKKSLLPNKKVLAQKIDLSVTRISPSSSHCDNECNLKEENKALASICSRGVELRIYSSDLVLQIAERFIK